MLLFENIERSEQSVNLNIILLLIFTSFVSMPQKKIKKLKILLGTNLEKILYSLNAKKLLAMTSHIETYTLEFLKFKNKKFLKKKIFW